MADREEAEMSSISATVQDASASRTALKAAIAGTISEHYGNAITDDDYALACGVLSVLGPWLDVTDAAEALVAAGEAAQSYVRGSTAIVRQMARVRVDMAGDALVEAVARLREVTA